MRAKLPSAAKSIGHKLRRQCFGERDDVQIGIQRGREVVAYVPVTAADAQFALLLDLLVGEDGGVSDFRGPYAQGPRGARFVYLSWGRIDEAGEFAMIGRVKLPLPALDLDALARLKDGNTLLTARAELSDARGRPVTGSLRAPQLIWEW